MKVQDKNAFDEQNVFGQGSANTAFAQYFIGNSYLNPLTKPGESVVGLANVTFEPGCRNNWHIHHAKTGGGQILICTAGEGWYQEEGKEAVSLTPGTVIVIPPQVKHWHGAKAGSWFSHIAVEVPGEETSNEWLEPVRKLFQTAVKGPGARSKGRCARMRVHIKKHPVVICSTKLPPKGVLPYDEELSGNRPGIYGAL